MKKYFLFLIIHIFVNYLYATNYYISINGSDNNTGLSQTQAWATFSHAISRINAGDELIIGDGTYYQSLSISKSGNSNSRIKIGAINDGKVIIDGQNTRIPMAVSGNYMVISGIVTRNSSGDVFKISGDYNIIQRCSAYNANPNANVHRFTITGDYNLLEDCVAGGTGRYCFLNYDARENTLRRCFGKWESHNGGSPRAAFSNYGANSILMENCIALDVFPNEYRTSEYFGVYQTHASYNTRFPTDNCRYYGCIFYNNLLGGMMLNPSTGPHTEIINCVIFDHDRTDPFGAHSSGTCGRGIYGGAQYQMIVKNCTFVNNRVSGVTNMGSDPLLNSIFVKNGTAIVGGTHDYCCFYNNTDNGVALNSTDIQANPGFENGCYLYIPDNSPCKGAGRNGEDIGANILYRYVDGVLTNEPLWPWPMNQRILDEIDYDVTTKLFSGAIPDPIFNAIIDANPLTGTIPLNVNFFGNTNDGNPPYSFFWDFGDGSTSNQQSPNHIYYQEGSYTAVLTVTDNNGNHATASITIQAIDPSNVLSIRDIRFTLPSESNEISQLQRETWYDLYLYFNTPNGWSEISFADVWINSPSYTEGTIENRGGVFHATSNYVMSFSVTSGYEGIWAREIENSTNMTDVTGILALYVDARNDEYQINRSGGWIKAKMKLLSEAQSGNWKVNTYVKYQNGICSSKYEKDILVIASDTAAPFPPQNVTIR